MGCTWINLQEAEVNVHTRDGIGKEANEVPEDMEIVFRLASGEVCKLSGILEVVE